jgi:hypothetical protein
MIESSINRLKWILDKLPSVLTQISEEKMSEKASPNKWSKKEILGHLIDSATNNHQRIIRGQYENVPAIIYDQDQWNQLNHYNKLDAKHLIHFWILYNNHLLEIMKHIPNENLKRKVKIGENNFTIEELFIDYVVHLEHHLKQLME